MLRKRTRSPMWAVERGALAAFVTLIGSSVLAVVMSDVALAVIHAVGWDALVQVMRM